VIYSAENPNTSNFVRMASVALLPLCLLTAACSISWTSDDIAALNEAANSKDYATVLKLSQKLADEGNPSGTYHLGYLHEHGFGVAQDFAKSQTYYRQAADKGHGLAQNNLGTLYYRGLGVPKNLETAFKYYGLSAAQTVPVAQYNIGAMYQSGEGVTKNEAEAVKYFKLSADQGFVNAQSTLGGLYSLGQGVEKNEGEALRLMRLAAVQGSSEAQYNLGIVYASSENAAIQSLSKSHIWLLMAAQAGDADAKVSLRIVEKKLTAEQVTSGKAEAQRCVAEKYAGCD
jgi:uncharacterized protein